MTKVADFQSVKTTTSTRTTKSAVGLYFLLTSLLQTPDAGARSALKFPDICSVILGDVALAMVAPFYGADSHVM